MLRRYVPLNKKLQLCIQKNRTGKLRERPQLAILPSLERNEAKETLVHRKQMHARAAANVHKVSLYLKWAAQPGSVFHMLLMLET